MRLRHVRDRRQRELHRRIHLIFQIGGALHLHAQHAHGVAALERPGHLVQIAVEAAQAAAAVQLDGMLHRAVVGEPALFQIHAAIAQLGDGAHVMADVQHRAAVPGHVAHLIDALLLKRQIAHGQHLVADQQVGGEMRRHREGELDVHARRIALDRRVDELLDLGELDDLPELGVHLCAAHAEDRAVEIDIVPAGQLVVEAGADFQQAGHAAMDADFALGGRGDAGDELQKRGFARAVQAHDGQRVAAVDAEAHVVQREEGALFIVDRVHAQLGVGVLLAAQAAQPRGQVVVQRAAADLAEAIFLGNAVDLQQSFRHMRPSFQTVSMKVFSVCEKSTTPSAATSSVTPMDRALYLSE